MFSANQIEELIHIIRFQHTLYGVQISGKDVISNDDLTILKKFGIHPSKLDVGIPHMEQAYQFGRLASALGNYDTSKIKYDDFKKFIQGGGHRALSTHEQNILKAINTNTFSAVKGLGERVAGEFTRISTAEQLKRSEGYKTALREELSSGVKYRKSVSEITRELGKRTGDWSRDLGRLVETEANNAFQEGKASELSEKHGDDVKVYKDVYSGACGACIKAYLTGGIDSKPIIFKLSELKANGTNVGKKVADYLPVIGSHHPRCRCTLNKFQDGYVWSESKRVFEAPKGYKQRYDYDISIKIGGNTFHI